MAFQIPITIYQAIQHIQNREYVLPAIQREFVWPTHRIERLFDSLMRNYPIGSFLFWEVRSESIRKFQFYDFRIDYHQKDSPNARKVKVSTKETVTAVLDGQQRLTALNIALNGTYAYKLPRLWWDNPDAFPVRQLYLNLFQDAPENDRGMKYDFRFLTKKEAERQDESQFWYPVCNIIEFKRPNDPNKYLQQHLGHMTLEDLDKPTEILQQLREVVHVKPVISFYQETSQNIDRVLDVFIRTNSGGMTLNRSDMLMSIATAHWNGNARDDINGSVRKINGPQVGEFGFSRDFLLKAAFLLAGISSIDFKVSNFTIDHIESINEQWEDITDAVYSAARLLRDYGYSRPTLTAHSVVLPVAYYFRKYGKSVKSNEDTKSIRQWITRSLLKRTMWSGNQDSLLTRLRKVIDEHGHSGFPYAKIEEIILRRGGRLAFESEELQDLAESKDRAFALLSTLYPIVDIEHHQFHIDHIFPKSRFTPRSLGDAGVPEEQIPIFMDRVDRLPNLQLLPGGPNQAKGATLPYEWLAQMEDDKIAAEHRRLHDLGEVPKDITGFNVFYEARRERLLAKMENLLGINSTIAQEKTG